MANCNSELTMNTSKGLALKPFGVNCMVWYAICQKQDTQCTSLKGGGGGHRPGDLPPQAVRSVCRIGEACQSNNSIGT